MIDFFIVAAIILAPLGLFYLTNQRKASAALLFASIVITSLVIAYFLQGTSEAISKSFIDGAIYIYSMMSIGNVIYYATSKRLEERDRANLAEYKLHLLSSGSTLAEIDEQYEDILGNGRSSMKSSAEEWANSKE